MCFREKFQIGMTALVVCGAMSTFVDAKSPAATMFLLEGRCHSLAWGDNDLSKGCDSRLLNSVHPDGRTGFYYTIRTASVITFSGKGRQSKTDADSATQPVDQVIWNFGSGMAPIVKPATGQCRFSNPYKGSARITCRARTSDGEASGEFETNGAPPISRRF
jgi:hypothetical protein